ncbi:hypothetical protein JDV02_005339 [Purpureocillium takamizusanense]|uniref:Uncharacterized protein n=1 Tax=Purpureocillium takamizusanense TaxID=2060973 RepID=A0A9Q8QHT6_9HYPO|nr:uncharacterized protein JDV02_005339 [Purpureocillium takamizusanense]UNI19124.1 hypothetical protein JDV02_005339 [Purpureocillium takamizusanense]
MAARHRQMLPLTRRLTLATSASGPSTTSARLPLTTRTLPVVVPLLPAATTRRCYASGSGSASKQPSATSQFYKTFTRPIAKVLLLAVFTYQVVYWSWMKLEADEVREERDATIAELEATVGAYDKKKKGEDGEKAGAEGKTKTP